MSLGITGQNGARIDGKGRNVIGLDGIEFGGRMVLDEVGWDGTGWNETGLYGKDGMEIHRAGKDGKERNGTGRD